MRIQWIRKIKGFEINFLRAVIYNSYENFSINTPVKKPQDWEKFQGWKNSLRLEKIERVKI